MKARRARIAVGVASLLSMIVACGARSSLLVASGVGGEAEPPSSSVSATSSSPGCTLEVCDGVDNDCNGIIDDGCAKGCSDGTREGFVDEAEYPNIAGCSGGWSVPGVLGTLTASCGRIAGNSSPNPSGNGCSVADLCALGFHVCTGPDDVAAHSPTGCTGAAPKPGLFFATRQSSNGCGQCALGTNLDSAECDGCSCMAGCAQTARTANDLYGCGSLGDAPIVGCGALDRFSHNLCSALTPAWSCGTNGCAEANEVTKSTSSDGGVLCCAD